MAIDQSMKEIAKAFSELTKRAKEVRDMFSLTEPEVRSFGSSLLVIQDQLNKFDGNAISQMGSFLAESMAGTIEVFDKFNLQANQLSAPVENKPEEKKEDKDEDEKEERKSIVEKLKKFGSSISDTTSKLKSSMESVSTSFTSALKSPLSALGSFSGPFEAIIDMAGKFVSSLNPALMEQLQLAFDDLTAVIGRGFAPVIGAAIPIVRTFADAMVPVIASLIPAFTVLSNAMLEVAGPVIGIFTSVITAIQPLLLQMAEAISKVATQFGSALLPIIEALMPYYMALLQIGVDLVPALGELLGAFMSLTEPLIRLIVPILVPALQMLAKVIIWIVNKFSWIVGKVAQMVNKIAPQSKVQILKPPKIQAGASAGAATKGASFQGFSEFGRQMMEAAFGSGVGTPEIRTADGVEKLVKLAERQEARDAANAPQFVINQPARGKF